MHIFRSLLVVFSVSFLAACGGGGESSVAPSMPEMVKEEVPVDGSKLIEGSEWKAEFVGRASAIKAQHGLDYLFNLGFTGVGVDVVVIDDGFRTTHEQLSHITLGSLSGSYTTKFKVEPETDILDPTQFDSIYHGEVDDSTGHGSNVVSIIASTDFGAAVDVNLTVVDNLSPEFGVMTWVFDDFTTQLINENIGIFNVSQSSCEKNNTAGNQVASLTVLRDSDAIIVCGGGNNSANLTHEFVDRTSNIVATDAGYDAWQKTPGFADNFIFVGAVDDDNKLVTDFGAENGLGSNYPGTDTDMQSRWIVANGMNHTGANYDADDSYVTMSGTSQATPLVTSAIVLLQQAFPDLSPAELAEILLLSANRDFVGYNAEQHGMGLLDAKAAYDLAATL